MERLSLYWVWSCMGLFLVVATICFIQDAYKAWKAKGDHR